ncbi:hypothetical protein P152DRAFT_464570 [Eremomyces bilateralis CBS 781.70]|uniref:Sodium/calcium exchanger membrane region domain-containing protein n=1 Tax=Eremomyces bilateralis CBS 781.70 TaxID=1392243 RepID=A0A6G1GD76_9PEZI|nr:uncharacterized protein P152DRAFT_464570 [Eremomyces bilateralis CBS 781.70]KAF1815860.1 hypothetical protein P152DRAFT_464570 [Eremomyces bilateralis CBS 781.70]
MTSFVTSRTPNSGGYGSSRLGRQRTYSARPFVWTLIIVSILISGSLLSAQVRRHDRNSNVRSPLLRRDIFATTEDLACHLVHKAEDQCAFVQQNCADEEAGLFSYLQLYYCRLPQAKPLAITIIVLWLGLLFSTIGIAASDFFCVNLSTISSILGMSESLAGVTLLAFGNGSPDVFSTFAAMSTNSGSLAVGELFGAAGFITAMVAGSMALVRPFRVNRKSFIRDVCFFLVSASFSLVFLWDGRLYLWECGVMVGFYIFYVAFVVTWHWWLGRRKKQRIRDVAARGQYASVDANGDVEPIEPYRDEDEGDTGTEQTPRHMAEDFPSLEADHEPGTLDEDDEEARERVLGRLSSNMRLIRPNTGRRPTGQNPIRPSLVGALEFRAVLSSLQKSRNIMNLPINLRRYSDDPTLNLGTQQDQLSFISDPAARSVHSLHADSGGNSRMAPSARPRAVSTNDAEDMSTDAIPRHGANLDFLSPHDAFNRVPESQASSSRRSSTAAPPSPSVSVSPATSLKADAHASPPRPKSTDFLMPPDASLGPPRVAPSGNHAEQHQSYGATHSKPSPKLVIPTGESGSSPATTFPPYTDNAASASSSRAPSIRLPPPSISSDYFSHVPDMALAAQLKPLSWWPYTVLPSPTELFSTLFPTLYSWGDKNIWERVLGIIAAPSVFLLTITLPVVENDKIVEDDDFREHSLPALSRRTTDGEWARKSTAAYRDDVTPGALSPLNAERQSVAAHRDRAGSYRPFQAPAELAASQQHYHERAFHPQNAFLSPSESRLLDSPMEMPSPILAAVEEEVWDRWLVIIQIFTAPFFVVLIVWANMDGTPAALLRPSLIALLISLVLLLFILKTTTPSRPPKWRKALCAVGFIVSVSWISTIAGEVVGVLKTVGVIFNISDAILGLTIFAVGNSLGDLVANITVARLGYPVMALSACFGGPMLNILLGIGLSGGYMTIGRASHTHEKHPDQSIRFKPYKLDVSRSLIVSGAALVVILVGLLIIVPLRGWKMDRWVGTFLIVLWVVSTAGNVIGEVFIFGME